MSMAATYRLMFGIAAVAPYPDRLAPQCTQAVSLIAGTPVNIMGAQATQGLALTVTANGLPVQATFTPCLLYTSPSPRD